MVKIGRDTKITWYGHATFLYETPGGKRIMIDPWLQNNPACPDNMKSVDNLDAMLITHGHFDHIQDAVQTAKQATPSTVLGILEIGNWLTKKGVEGCVGMNKGGTTTVEGIRVTMLVGAEMVATSDGIAWMALRHRLRNTCWMRSGSASTSGTSSP